MRKIIVISLIGVIILAGNILVVANWIAKCGIEEKANYVKDNFLTGTALCVICALLILLAGPQKSGGKTARLDRRCPVCDQQIANNANYCSNCGSKV